MTIYVAEYDENGNHVLKDNGLWNWIEKSQAMYGPQGEKHTPDQAHMIMGDIEPYQSTIDGSYVGSRSTHRKHLKQHGCVEVGTENIGDAQKQVAPKKDITAGVKDDIARAYDKVANG